MDRRLFTYLVILILILGTQVIAQKVRKKMAKPAVKSDVQTPGTFDRVISKVIMGIAVLSTIMGFLGAIAGVAEMALVFLGMSVVFWGIYALLKREYNMSYQENEEYFILNTKGKEYKVFYDNIVDWVPGMNEIQLLDQTKEDKKYIRVNVAMLRPEILLQKIVDMTLAGKYEHVNQIDPEDPMRLNELTHFLDRYNYSHLMDEYGEQ